RIVGELVKRLGRHRRGSFCPFGGHRRGCLPGSEELPSWAVSGGTHHCIVSPRRAGDQRSRDRQSLSLCAKSGTVVAEARTVIQSGLLTCGFQWVGEGTRTPAPQDHNLVL